jgi:uncharacterized repeat protein (TIGR03803 family)
MRRNKVFALILLCGAIAIIAPAQTFKTLVNFDGTNGAFPAYGSLVQATNGDLYGATQEGGATNYGTIFKITPSGVLTTIHSFDLTDGATPVAGLVQATNGDLYGTTANGGAYGGTTNFSGTIFKITPAGILTTLYSFCAQTNCADGADPAAGLIQASDGDLYGTTQSGGANNEGTIFKLTLGGALTTLHSFDWADGAEPVGGLLQATNGDLYGTTYHGGANNEGTVFKLTLSGALTTLHVFDGTDGAWPNAGLVQATNGDLYGTTMEGGPSHDGSIFKITPAGALTTIHNFHADDGAYPFGLIQATNGVLYGATSAGGADDIGTIFEITSAGVTTLHSFSGPDGWTPEAGLLQDTNGDFYGTTQEGGTNGDGTIFRLSLGLAPFVKTLPTVGLVGSPVKILGSDLTGATSVTFNDVPAAFTVVSAREISTTVPTAATTGKVEVVTPSSTLVSNVGFAVP